MVAVYFYVFKPIPTVKFFSRFSCIVSFYLISIVCFDLFATQTFVCLSLASR